ncbi:TPA: hypothetical protein I7122_18325 [Vibrio vulnificus]|nr:hypothetical protein [Vibrio vulnificus]
MKIEKATVTKLYLSEIPKLDPVGVFLEDYQKGQGKITIECFGESWSHYWPAMGGRSLTEFFVSCNVDYLARKLSDVKPGIDDYEAFEIVATKEVLRKRRADELDADKAREIYDELKISSLDSDDGEWWCRENPEILEDLFGEEWWYSIPKKENPNFGYVCRIITAVQEGLKQYNAEQEEETCAA